MLFDARTDTDRGESPSRRERRRLERQMLAAERHRLTSGSCDAVRAERSSYDRGMNITLTRTAAMVRCGGQAELRSRAARPPRLEVLRKREGFRNEDSTRTTRALSSLGAPFISISPADILRIESGCSSRSVRRRGTSSLLRRESVMSMGQFQPLQASRPRPRCHQ